MKIGMYYNNRDVRVQELPVPEPGLGEILVKVMASGICGSDIMEWYRIKKAPLVLGHEVAGRVVKIGAGVTKFKEGDRVFSTHHVPCGQCRLCQNGSDTACETFHKTNNFSPGGFAQYLKISGRSIDTGTFVLPDTLTYEQGSFIEPLGTVVRGMRTLGIRAGDSVLVLGAGIAGLLNIKLARALGAGRVMASDVSPFRLSAAKNSGAEYAFLAGDDIPSRIKEVNDGRLADRVIVCTGALSALSQGLGSVERGGTVLLFAVPKPGETLPIDFNPYWRDDITFKTSYGAAPPDNRQAMELLRAGNVRVDDLVTHRLSIDDIGEGFSIAARGAESLKVIIKPNSDE